MAEAVVMKNANEFFKDLEGFRTPQEMEQYFNKKKQIIINDEEYTKLARLKKGRFKEFLEEYYPLYCFSQSNFCNEDSKCKIIIGNQNYDGIIIKPNGVKKRIEITSYIDGKWEYKNAEKLNEKGIGNLRFGDFKSLEERALDYLDDILHNAKKKSNKNYQGVSLLFAVSTTDFFGVFNNSASQFIATLKNEISKIEFVADEVYLLILNDQGIDQINENIYRLKSPKHSI